MSARLEKCLVQILKTDPGLPAKFIAPKCRHELADHSITKRVINPILYRRTRVFRYVGQNPPCWYLREELEHVTTPKSPPGKTKRRAPSASKKKRRKTPAARPPCLEKLSKKLRPLSKDLYKWQAQAIDAWRKAKNKSVIEAVTGTGKTFVGISLLHEYIQKQKRCLVIVPSIVLFHQWKEEIETELGFELTSLLGAGHKDLDLTQPITLGVLKSVSTAAKNGELYNNFGLLIADECHRFASKTHQLALLEDVSDRIGLTATLERSDDGVDEILKPYFTASKRAKRCSCFVYGFREAKRDKIIATFVTLPIGVELDDEERDRYIDCDKRITKGRNRLISQYGYPEDFKKFMSRAGKPKTKEESILLSKFFSGMSEKKQILAESRAKAEFFPELAEIIGNSNGTIVYVETIDAATQLAESLDEYEFHTEPFHSKLSATDRETIFERFRSKKTLCLTAVHCLDEGINVPDANCAVIIASTKQRRQMIQRMGRILRLKHDETGSVFIHIYARQTSEDPNGQNVDDEYYLSALTKEAFCTDILRSEDFEDYDVMGWIRDLVHWD